ncbi:hypothetical protein PHMEG_00027906 [Phytophthora megakarya]|uniref:Uncharacterized protein n=1 Tax=Phytophthora megakarya TaxID=4795 RepID=A0A225V5U4_9STRA|nr:hypothetical protein PHMEG_00027906 [Phytophthora megakarya]
MAYRIHKEIEELAGATLYHDGLDEGEDDLDLVRHVDQVSNRNPSDTEGRSLSQDQGVPHGYSSPGDGSVEDQEDQDEDHEDGNVLEDRHSGFEDPGEAYPDRDAVCIAQETVGDTRTPAEIDSRDTSRVSELGGLQSSKDAWHSGREDGSDVTVMAPHSEASREDEGTTTRYRQSYRYNQKTSASARDRPASGGRSRRRPSDPFPTQATPNGKPLHRDPANIAADADEMARYRCLSVTCARLGGQDLRILRDNFEEMGGRKSTSGEKRPAVESPASSTFSSTKRMTGKKRLEALQEKMNAEINASRDVAGSEMMQMLTFFQRQADRRAEQEDKLRPEEREDQRNAEKEERLERERVRREESAAVEARIARQEERESKQLEERRSREEIDWKQREEDKEERRRQFEQKMKLEKDEARQRHEQMMLLLSSIIAKK